jgi:hypothetical protein
MIPWGPETIFIHLVNPGGSATFIYLSDTDISHMHIPLATYTSRRYIDLSQEWQSEPIGLCSQILTDSRGTTWEHSEILISLSRSYTSVIRHCLSHAIWDAEHTPASLCEYDCSMQHVRLYCEHRAYAHISDWEIPPPKAYRNSPKPTKSNPEAPTWG